MYYMQSETDPTDPPVTPGPITNNDINPPVDPKPKDPIKNPEVENKEPLFSKTDFQKETLRQLSFSARQANTNRGRALLRRMAAEGYLLAGQTEEADEHLEFLKTDTRAAPFLPLLPLSDLAMTELKNKNKEAADIHLDEIIKISERLPRKGEEASFFVTAVTIALLAGDRDQQANDLLKDYQDDAPNARWGCTMRNVISNRSFDAELESQFDFNRRIQYPQSVATVRGLSANGFPEKALQWIKSRNDKREQYECKVGLLTEQILTAHRDRKSLDNSTLEDYQGRS